MKGKNCENEIYLEILREYQNEDKAIYEMCKLLDLYFSYDVLSMAKTQRETALKKMTEKGEVGEKTVKKSIGTLYSYYRQKVYSLMKVNAQGESFKDSDVFDNEISEAAFVDEETKRFWGTGFGEHEYQYLQDKFNNFLKSYECDSPVMESLLKQASFEELEIHYKRQSHADVSKNLKNLQDILGSANIKPNQETGANANDQQTFGTFIKKLENERPISKPLPEWEDVDKVGWFFTTFVLGHILRLAGIHKDKDVDDDYQDELNKYTIDIDEEMEKANTEIESENEIDDIIQSESDE